jgi:chromosome segregation ATPase
VTSLEKIRESIDAVVASVMRSHADQLRNEVSEHVRVHLEEDAKALSVVEAQLRERAEQTQTLEQQLTSTRNEIAEKQKHVEAVEQQLRSLEVESAQLRSRVGEVEGSLAAETEKLNKQNKELEQLLEMSQDEVKQLQQREDEQKQRLQQHEAEIGKLRSEMQEGLKKQEEDHKQALETKEREFAEKTALVEKQLEASKADAVAIETLKVEHTRALAAKEQELKSQIAHIEQRLEKAQAEALEQVQGKEKELLEQVHLLEELLVQGQHAREQQLEAKDRDLQEKLDAQKAEHEAKLAEIQSQLADRDKLLHAQGGELQDRIVAMGKDLEGVRTELKDTQAAFEQAQKQLDEANAATAKREEEFKALKQQLDKQTAAHQELEAKHGAASAQKSDLEGMQGLWEQREKELTAQLGDFEKRLSDYAAAEKSWHEREQELLGHRDKVLSSSAEASSASQQALVTAQAEQARLQTELDAMLQELATVREELQQTQAAHQSRERELSQEVTSLRNELVAQGGSTPKNVVSISDAPAVRASTEDQSAAIHSATEKIHAARSQSEILKALLDSAAQFSGRSGILVVHGRTATGWAGRGFGADAEFRRLSVECAKGLAGRVVQTRKYASGQAKEFDQKLLQSFGAPQDGHAHLFPLVVRDRVAAFFYADCGAEQKQDVSAHAIESVVRAAGAWLDELAGNKVTPKSGADVLPTPMASTSTAPVEPAPVAVMAAFAGGATTTAVAPAPSSGDNTEAARLRARRFAKLLVDEIKLYNKDAVEQGRRNSDLYDRLRESIDKSRASYDKRWGKTINDADYFREELVRNLADNNVEVLGSNFPR